MATKSGAVGLVQSVLGDQATFGGAPAIENTTASIQAVGEFLNEYTPRLNQFINALVDRIGETIYRTLYYEDPWKFMDKGSLRYGATVYEIYTMMQNAAPFAPSSSMTSAQVSESELKSAPPTAYTAFHAVNSRLKYKVTINQSLLETAFLDESSLNAFIQNIVNQLYTPAYYDSLIIKKYIIYLLVKKNKLKVIKTDAVEDEATGKKFVKAVKKVLGKMKFISKDYNIAGVPMASNAADMYVIKTTDVTAETEVDVLASAFNLDKVTFMGHQIDIDSFALNEYEVERLCWMMTGSEDGSSVSVGGDTTFTAPTVDDPELAGVQAVIMTKDFMQIYDKLDELREFELGSTLDRNYWHHVWRIYSASPFENAAVFSSYSA